MIPPACPWVVVYDCGESEITPSITEEEAWGYQDPLGCRPEAVHPLRRCVLKNDPWMKDGRLRCILHEVKEE